MSAHVFYCSTVMPMRYENKQLNGVVEQQSLIRTPNTVFCHLNLQKLEQVQLLTKLLTKTVAKMKTKCNQSIYERQFVT